jgi:hypothetical protein
MSAPLPRGGRPTTERVAFRLDRAARTVTIEAHGPVRPETYRRVAFLLARRHPEASDHARVYDLRGYTGTVRHEDVVRLNRALAEDAGVAPREIVVVTTDPAFPLWARALEATLPTRPSIAVVATPDEVPAALESLRRAGPR